MIHCDRARSSLTSEQERSNKPSQAPLHGACCVLIALWVQICACEVCATATSDLRGLRALYDSLGGAAWEYPSGTQIWDFDDSSTQYCQWSGVHCCPAPGEDSQAVHLRDQDVSILCNSSGLIMALELQDMDLKGKFPAWDEIRSLQSLVLLNVSLNTGDFLYYSMDVRNLLPHLDMICTEVKCV